jgi:type I restriction enzyme M protein
MPIKKSELYSSLWKSCDELRGSMDASQYKDYVLVLLFVKYVSDRYAGQPDALIEVPAGGSFADMVALKGDKEIGDKINKIIARLAEANDLKGAIDVADFNNPDKLGRGKEMVDRLSNLVAIFENPSLDFRKNRAEGDDLLGDAYEYLMRHFATQSGKAKGQFLTPSEVSRVMAQVIGIAQATRQDWTAYDPTCGSGSLLLKVADEAPRGVTIYGQEMDNATAALAKMNMILHDNPTAEIWQGNTLSSPHWLAPDGGLKTFDFVVANFPFSTKAWSSGFDPANDVYGRFELGIPPAKNGDYAFLLHILKSMKSTGKGAVILPHGVLFRGNVEATIRKAIVRRGYIKGIIGLPANLFYGTGIPACIIVLDKEHAAGRRGIFMIDASKGFMKDGNMNRLRHQDIHKIVDVFNNQIELPGYARLVPLAEIEANDYNLNIPRYIDGSEPEDIQDIEAHLRGGIPNRDIDALDRYWALFPALKQRLFSANSRSGYSELRAPAGEIKAAILADADFVAYRQRVDQVFARWQAGSLPWLKGIAVGSRPKQLIERLSEDLLRAFAGVPLIDKYDVYQRLMTYWTETMQDDVYMIAVDGWRANEELLPPPLVIARYFAAERRAIDALEAQHEAIGQQMEALDEEQGGESGLLEEVKNDKGKISKAAVKARLKEIVGDAEAGDELAMLTEYLKLMDHEAETSKQIRDAQKALAAMVVTRYKTLNEDEVKTLVVDDKWLAALAATVQRELERISQGLAGRVKELAERYVAPLPQVDEDVDVLSTKVDAHLSRMGFTWT